MRLLLRHGVLLCSLLLLFGCNENGSNIDVISESDFGETITLKESRVETKELLNIRKLIIQDTLLLINNSREDSLFMAFNLNTLECIKSWGVKGNGPNEHGVFTHLIKMSQDKFKVVDFSQNRVETYSIPEFKRIEEVKINNSKIQQVPQQIVVDNSDQTYYYDNLSREKLSLLEWGIGEKHHDIYKFEEFQTEYKDPMSYSGSLALNEEDGLLIYSYRYIRRFDIINKKGELVKRVKITPSPGLVVEDKNNINTEESTICYTRIKVFKNSLFILYVGHKTNDLIENDLMVPCAIEEYDFNGKPIKRYKIERYLSDFDVFEDKNGSISFIGIDQNHEHPLIIFNQ